MGLLDLLNAIDDAGITLTLDGPSFKVGGPRHAMDALRADIKAHRNLLHAHLLGVASGHLLAFCTGCSAPTITSVKTSSGSKRETWPACRDTPGCGGRNQHGTAAARHLPRPCDLAARADCPAPPPRPRPPAKAAKSRLLGPPAPWPEPRSPKRTTT